MTAETPSFRIICPWCRKTLFIPKPSFIDLTNDQLVDQANEVHTIISPKCDYKWEKKALSK